MSAVHRSIRDPWQWLPLLAVVPLLVHAAGAPASFDLLGPLLVAHPWVVVALHLALLAASAWLVFRTLRPEWPGSAAAVAAMFPLFLESCRLLIGWPDHLEDLGAIFFSVLALHEAARGRLATTLVSLLAALLCREIAAVTVLLVPWLPAGRARRRRGVWLGATLALLALGGAASFAARRLPPRATFTSAARSVTTAPPGAQPLGVEHAFAGDRAIQVWDRDGTLPWSHFEQLAREPELPALVVVEYPPQGEPRFALVDGAAMRALLAAVDRLKASDPAGALESLDRAEQAQRDPTARVFLGTIAAKRAVALAALGRATEAESAARRALDLWPSNPDSRTTLAGLRIAEHRYAAAESLLVEQLALDLGEPGATALLERTRSERAPSAEAR